MQKIFKLKKITASIKSNFLYRIFIYYVYHFILRAVYTINNNFKNKIVSKFFESKKNAIFLLL